MKILVLFIASIFIVSIVEAQTKGAIIDQLNAELFPANTEEVYLYEFIICENHKIDSTIRIRKNQPNSDAVIAVLGKLMLDNNASDFDRMYSIYKKHISNFKEEWGQAYLDNFYCCDVIQKQFNVLKAFEIVLRSLKFKKDNTAIKEIFNFHITEMKMTDELIRDPTKREILKKYKVFSKEYRKFNSIAWLKGDIPYSYLDAYLEELKPYFINYIQQCKWNKGLPQECMIVWRSMNYYLKINDNRLAEYFLNNFNNWELVKRNSPIYKYAGIYYYPKLTKMLIKDLISPSNKTEEYVKQYLFRLCSSSSNKTIIKETLKIEATKKWNPFAIKLLRFFPDKNTIQYLKKLQRKKYSTKAQQLVIERVISSMNTLNVDY